MDYACLIMICRAGYFGIYRVLLNINTCMGYIRIVVIMIIDVEKKTDPCWSKSSSISGF